MIIGALIVMLPRGRTGRRKPHAKHDMLRQRDEKISAPSRREPQGPTFYSQDDANLLCRAVYLYIYYTSMGHYLSPYNKREME